jgi:hypothetical protein
MVNVYRDSKTSLHFSPGIERVLGERKAILTNGGSYNAVVLPLKHHPSTFPTLKQVGTINT